MKNLNLGRKEINSKGITLVALIVTIIVLLILAGVTIITLTGDNGLLTKSKSAVDKYSDGEIEEQVKLSYQEYHMEKSSNAINKTASEFMQEKLRVLLKDDNLVVLEDAGIVRLKFSNKKVYKYEINVQYISKSTEKKDSYVGYYADVDSDGTVDGVIFVDLLTGSYTLPVDVTVDNVKSYYISQENYTNSHFGTHPVISPKIESGEERFYIMQLSDFTTPEKKDNNNQQVYPAYTAYTWYKNAGGKMDPLVTLETFGSGKTNTYAMIEKWNAAKTEEGYDAEKNNQDIWNHIQAKYNEGWFVPSIKEWLAFVKELGITQGSEGNFQTKYGLSNSYWSSTQRSESNAAYIDKDWSYLSNVNGQRPIRLAKTF